MAALFASFSLLSIALAHCGTALDSISLSYVDESNDILRSGAVAITAATG